MQSAQRQRQDTWDQRMPTIQALAQAIAEAHSDRAFFVYMVASVSPSNVNVYQFAPRQLQSMFDDPHWLQLLQSVRALPAQPVEAGTSTSADATAYRQRKSKRPQQQQSQPTASTGRTKRRKLHSQHDTAVWHS